MSIQSGVTANTLVIGGAGYIGAHLVPQLVASGIVNALERGHLSETYNLGSGNGLSNLDVIEAIKPLMYEIGCEVRVENLLERAFDVRANVLDSAKLQQHTGWTQHIEFAEGLRRTCEWLRATKK